MKAREIAPLLPMSITVKPYCHQVEAFNFVCQCLGVVTEGGGSFAEGSGQMPSMRQGDPEAKKPGA